MTFFSKLLVSGILFLLLLIPGIDATLLLPVIAALGYIWGFAPTEK